MTWYDPLMVLEQRPTIKKQINIKFDIVGASFINITYIFHTVLKNRIDDRESETERINDIVHVLKV